MADAYVDGNFRIAFVLSIANIAAPTVAELNLGILLSKIVPSGGVLNFEASTGKVPTDAVGDVFDTATIGRDTFGEPALRMKKQTGTDTPYTTMVRGTEGYVVMRRDIATGTGWVAGQSVEVYPVTCGREKLLPPEKNTVRQYEVPTPIRDQPNLRAVVAA